MMKEQELVAAIDREISTALGEESDSLSEQRAKSMEYYLGEPYGNEQADRSNIVTREVLDTLEWIKPELMKLFASGSETVRFEPQNADDVEQAQQATDYVNYLFHRKNPGFKILYEWITDGLLQKMGVVKAWFDVEATKVREEYSGLTDMELQVLAMRDDIELVEREQTDLGHNVTVIRTGAQSGLKIEVIPPEEFLISRKADCVESSPFCAHQRRMTISDLRAMGYEDLDDLPSGDTGITWEQERQARHSYDNTDREANDSQPSDDTMREVWVTEAYIRTDYDEDGIAELRRVLKVSDRVLENEEVECHPFATWSPIIIPHKFHGLSVADLVMDLQRLQSQLFRNMLDNQYLVNNGRYLVMDGMANMDDLTTSRPHGVVRIKTPGAVSRLDTPQLGQTAFAMLDYVDKLRERRTGVSERTQGLDPNQLGANQAATAVNQVMTASMQRIELIARVFGETGLTDLFRLIYKLVIQNQTSKDIFRLRDNYIEVDPSEWRERKDTSVVVGLGNGSRESEMLQLNMVFQNQMALASNPAFAGVVAPANIYNILEDQVKVFNKASSGRYFTDPNSPQAQQAQMQQMQQAQQAQAQQEALLKTQIELESQRLLLEQMKAQNADQNKKSEIAIKERAQDLKEVAHEDDTALRTAELSAEIELESEQERGVNLG